MIFAHDIIFVDEIREGVNNKLEGWRNILKAKGFRLSRSKNGYLKCQFSDRECGVEDEMTIRGVATPRVGKFRYLGSIIQERWDIDKDINYRIKGGWKKWKNA